MHAPIKVSEIIALNQKGQHLIYNNKSTRNLLIISSCRLSSFAYYFSNITDFNIYVIYVPLFINNETNVLCEVSIKKILSSTDIIICEYIKNYPGLNTALTNYDTTFFNKYGLDINTVKIYTVPTLELRYLSHSIMHIDNISMLSEISEEFINIRYERSKEILFSKIDANIFPKTKHFIQIYFKKIQLFHTTNHPCCILSLVLFIELAEKMGIKVDYETISTFIKEDFLGITETPIFKRDVDMYGFEYPVTIQSDCMFSTKNLHIRVSSTHLCEKDKSARLIFDYFNTAKI
uniref:Polysaccharide biosynthesis enzyme WcbI domain-containing protein n=1 Tax=viral metagenome TaxID=1070528 RepID=A0A6C0I5W5_9ZZZZ